MARSTLHLRRRAAGPAGSSSAPDAADRPGSGASSSGVPPSPAAEAPLSDPEGSNATRPTPDPEAERHPVSGQAPGGGKPRGPFTTGNV